MQLPDARLRPRLLQVADFAFPADQWACRSPSQVTLGHHEEIANRFVDSLDGLGKLRLEFESGTDELFDSRRNGDGARFGETADPSGEVGGEAVNVILGGIQIRDSAVNSDPDVDVETEAAPHSRAE